MKLLRVKADGFKNCADNFEINLMAKSECAKDKEDCELLRIDEGLYVFNTVGIVGKNASGKTSALELLDWCYDLLSTFSLSGKGCGYHGVQLEMIFYLEKTLYKYTVVLDNTNTPEDRAVFKEQKLYCKRYNKQSPQQIIAGEWHEKPTALWDMAEDYSILRFILKEPAVREIYYDALMEVEEGYGFTYQLMKLMGLDPGYLNRIIPIFDRNISEIRQVDETHYILIYQGAERNYSGRELLRFLSGGTTKGMNLYILAVMSLTVGFDLLVDEIESCLHKTHVKNLIMLYKDRKVNRKNATLIFSTHDSELLDLFNRGDSIWVAHSEGKIVIENIYDKYGSCPGYLKSRFYQELFDSVADYEAMMNLKRMLMQ